MHLGSYGGKPRRICSDCGFIHFVEPKIAVAAMVLRGDELLLVKRGVVPEKGKWSLPAGYVDPGEHPAECMVREVQEETSLAVRAQRLVECYYNPPGTGANLTLVYRAQLTGGTLSAGDDAADAGFFTLDALPPLAFASTLDIVRRARRSVARRKP